MKALGIHVFAGGFTRGVQKVFEVKNQLEVHNFALDTARSIGIEPINCTDFNEWPAPDKDIVFAFGNPRCTGFSCVTGGCGADSHGPWSGQTRDIHEFSQYVVKHDIPIAVWESVTQAMTVGRELLDYLRDEIFVPNGYRIAHTLINAAAFDNAQQRLRYFFVAYKRPLQFNVEPMPMRSYLTSVYDVIHQYEKEEYNEAALYSKKGEYDGNSVVKLTPDERHCVPFLDTGWCINKLGRYAPDKLPPLFQFKNRHKMSDMPFSMHCPRRIAYWVGCPVLHSGAARFIHPVLDRPLMVKELAALMGWDFMPVGPMPHAQIAKGVVPAVGTWLAEQAKLCLEGYWGNENFSSCFNPRTGEFEGEYLDDSVHEKTLDLKHYTPASYNWPRDEADDYDIRFRNTGRSLGRSA